MLCPGLRCGVQVLKSIRSASVLDGLHPYPWFGCGGGGGGGGLASVVVGRSSAGLDHPSASRDWRMARLRRRAAADMVVFVMVVGCWEDGLAVLIIPS